MRISVIRQIDEFTREVFDFNVFDTLLVFVKYTIESKPKGKRIWRTEGSWDYYLGRMNTIKAEPELPNEVKNLAKEKFFELVKVLTSEEWKTTK